MAVKRKRRTLKSSLSKVKSKVTQSTDLAFFLEPPKTKRGWSDQKIRNFVRLSQTYTSKEKVAEKLKVSLCTASQMRTELRKAAREGYTLERYLQAGRPFAVGKKVIA